MTKRKPLVRSAITTISCHDLEQMKLELRAMRNVALRMITDYDNAQGAPGAMSNAFVHRVLHDATLNFRAILRTTED